MAQNLDIINFIEKNPIARLSKNYLNKLVTKIKEKFANEKNNSYLLEAFFVT